MSDLKVSSLVRKFCRPKLTGKRVPHGNEIQFLKFINRAQRVDKKKEVMFNPIVMVIKMSNMADFMYYLLDTAKYQFQYGQDI